VNTGDCNKADYQTLKSSWDFTSMRNINGMSNKKIVQAVQAGDTCLSFARQNDQELEMSIRQGLDVLRLSDVVNLQFRIDLADQPLQDIPRTHLEEIADPLLGHTYNRINPLNR